MMNIVCSIDNNYVQHCCVMLLSFFENNKGGTHSVYLLTEGLADENIKQIQNLVESYHGSFFYCLVDHKALALFPIGVEDHLTIATYYRLLMADILPVHLDKVIYLDCDIVINDSVQELWDTPLDGYALAAVEELGCSLPDVYERLGYGEKYGYFNAGVLLVNLAYWREFSLTRLFCDYVAENSIKLKAHDQDVLNALLHDKCLHIPYKWNVEEAFYHYSVIKRLEFNSELSFVLRHPAVLHYTWKPKPWDSSCKHPFRLNYFIYLQKLGKSTFTFNNRLMASIDKSVFCFLLRIKMRGHQYYKL